MDVGHISGYLKVREFRICPMLGTPSIVVIICRVVGGTSYVYTLEAENDFDVVMRIVAQDGIQIWVAGIHNEKCVQIATDEINRFHGEAIHTYINKYKKMACQEIGGNINVYYLDAIGYQKIIDNYDLDDGYDSPFYGVVANNIVGNLMASNKMFISNEKGSVLIMGDGTGITNGSICIANNDYSIEIDPKHRLGDYTRDNYLFCIRDKDSPIGENDDIIMGGDTSGSGYFKGSIEANEGKIANFNLSKNELFTDGATFKNEIGIYFGDSGLRIGKNFTLNQMEIKQ